MDAQSLSFFQTLSFTVSQNELNLHPGDILDNKTNNSNIDDCVKNDHKIAENTNQENNNHIGVLVDSVVQNESVNFSGTHIKHTENHFNENRMNEGKLNTGNVICDVAQNESVHYSGDYNSWL
jgi:hypothetical protein